MLHRVAVAELAVAVGLRTCLHPEAGRVVGVAVVDQVKPMDPVVVGEHHLQMDWHREVDQRVHRMDYQHQVAADLREEVLVAYLLELVVPWHKGLKADQSEPWLVAAADLQMDCLHLEPVGMVAVLHIVAVAVVAVPHQRDWPDRWKQEEGHHS